MEERRVNRMNKDGMPNTVFECVINYIDDVRDRDAISLVCKQWYNIDALTRRHVTIALCYAATPQQLWQRFKFLESLKLKGKPRAAMFNLIPEDWGGYATPWVDELATSFSSLKALHFRRMIVTDSNLELLAHSRGKVLHSLKLDNCSGFSTDGLLHITRFCRNLKTLFLEESIITDNDGRWLHELAVNNTVLQTLNFYLTDIHKYEYRDLELIAKNCQSLVSVKISDKELLDIVGFFRAATALEEFCGGSFSSNQPEQCALVPFPPRLCRLGLSFMSGNEMPIVFPFASRLTRLDLLYVLMDTEDHCALIPRCPNLEVLETRNVIGNIGLELLAWNCKKLRRLRIEHGADEEDLGDEEGFVSHVGLTALALGCPDLEYLAVYVSDITNACLECMGTHWKNLNDFRLVLLDNIEFIPDLPLDNGVRALLQGCGCIRRMPLDCQTGDGFLKYSGLKLPDTRNSWYNVNMTLEECGKKCLGNCSCMAYSNLDIRDKGSGCLLWFGNLVNMKDMGDKGHNIYVRMASSEIEVSNSSKKRRDQIIVVLASTIGTIILILGLCLYVWKKCKQLKEIGIIIRIFQHDQQKYTSNSQNDDLNLPLFELATIEKATNNFSEDNKLGKGGYGPVYKGMLEGGQEIAVKRLSRDSRQGLDEFKNEVIFIAKLQHRNLVKLLGCCIQREEKMLIYEYMPNNSLDSFLFGLFFSYYIFVFFSSTLFVLLFLVIEAELLLPSYL